MAVSLKPTKKGLMQQRVTPPSPHFFLHPFLFFAVPESITTSEYAYVYDQ